MIRPTDPIDVLRGVGPKTAEMFRGAGFETVADLLGYYPRTYDDYSNSNVISELRPGKVALRASVESVNVIFVRGNMKITTAILVDSANEKIKAVWYNQPYRKNQLAGGGMFLFSGNFDFKNGRYQLTSPSCVRADDLDLESDQIVPVYSVKNGIPQKLFKSAIAAAKSAIPLLHDNIPSEIIGDEDLLSLAEAVQQVHFPTSRQELKRAKDRLAFDEIFTLVLAAKLNKLSNGQLRSYEIKFNQPAIKKMVDGLPFRLTDEQKRSVWEILLDLQKPSPMNRLLQGDVGSGKTVVGAIASYQTAISGFQVAMMAPTEILAAQHFETISKILAGHGVVIELLTSSTKAKDRSEMLERLANDQVDILIGTHALLQDGVCFKKLGLVIIDEQHRFGVRQRQTLLAKSDHGNMPHLLSMTATPIPRSLQLTVFGDLDVSTIKQLPGGRKPITTKTITPDAEERMAQQIDIELDAGRQVYYVAKLIDESASGTTAKQISVKKLYDQVAKRFPDYRVGLLHGKMSSTDKDAIMTQFKNHDIDILVATTVIEVGVDVPNATVMVVRNADMFGLAQLHQLRGRIGRGGYKSYCYLMQSTNDAPTRRLVEMEKTQDGFYLAEVDLEMRGAGEIYGTAQHGQLNLQMANLADTGMLVRASRQATAVSNRIAMDAQYLTKYPKLGEIIDKYQKLTSLN